MHNYIQLNQRNNVYSFSNSKYYKEITKIGAELYNLESSQTSHNLWYFVCEFIFDKTNNNRLSSMHNLIHLIDCEQALFKQILNLLPKLIDEICLTPAFALWLTPGETSNNNGDNI